MSPRSAVVTPGARCLAVVFAALTLCLVSCSSGPGGNPSPTEDVVGELIDDVSAQMERECRNQVDGPDVSCGVDKGTAMRQCVLEEVGTRDYWIREVETEATAAGWLVAMRAAHHDAPEVEYVVACAATRFPSGRVEYTTEWSEL